jgi:hypothetical protein
MNSQACKLTDEEDKIRAISVEDYQHILPTPAVMGDA